MSSIYNFHKATLRLFKCLQFNRLDTPIDQTPFISKSMKAGFIPSPTTNFSNESFKATNDIFGLSGKQANATFHKSWKKIQDTPMETLVVEQILHYITTYGFEKIGMYSDETVFIPAEKLECPEITEQIPLFVIKTEVTEVILEKIIKLGSGIALHENTLSDIMTIIQFNNYPSKFVSKIKNRELKTLLNDHYGLVPTNPVEFLRYLITKLTGQSLLIKNAALIAMIKESNVKQLDDLMLKAPKNLGSIFLRYKPLFLALRSISENKIVFNRLRRDAKRMHKPLPFSYLDNVTMFLDRDQLIMPVFQGHLEKATIARKIRLAYALNFRMNPNKYIIYKVRTGRGWVTDFKWNWNSIDQVRQARDIVIESICDSIKGKVAGKNILIPDYINYTLPATEKQFTGNFPTGTYVTVPQNLICGIHWTDVDKHRVDLDLSTISIKGKTGWDAAYRSPTGDILFSGDITSAPTPKGATELFYFRKMDELSKVLIVNYFNHNKKFPVPTRILVAQDEPENFNRDYVIDINKIISQANIVIDQKETTLGLIAPVDKKLNFYFAQVSTGNSISSGADVSLRSLEYLKSNLINSIELKDVLTLSGANVIATKPEDESDYIDLSPEALDKNTIIDLIF